MKPRGVSRRFAVGALAIAAIVGVAVGIGVHKLSAGGGGRRAVEARMNGQAVWPAGIRRAPDFSLRDESGQIFSLSSARGRAVVLTFMDSRCRQECPLEGRALSAALRQLPGAQRPLVVVISVDPWADTPGSAQSAIRRFGLGAFDWRWLLGSRKRLEPVWRRYGIGVRRAAGDIEHTAALYLIDARGFERAGMAYPFLPTWISVDLRRLAEENGA
jgi:protein SCO1/2